MINKRNTLVGPQLQRGRTALNPDWKRLAGFLAVILLGSIVATQGAGEQLPIRSRSRV